MHIKVWGDDWLPRMSNFKVSTDCPDGFSDVRVSDLFIPGRREWDVELILEMFNAEDANKILLIPLSNQNHADSIIWHMDRKGLYTVKTGYRALTVSEYDNSGLLSLESWRYAWSLEIPSKVKSFVWRILSSCLPTREALFLKGLDVPNQCVFCGEYGEHSLHIFLNCQFAKDCFQCVGMEVSDLQTPTFS